MTRHTPDRGPDQQHQEVWELLPWYVNRTLETQERAHIEQHLVRCAACQAEITRCHYIATAVHLAEEPVLSPSPARFATLMAQIDATEPVGHPLRRWWATLRHALCRYGALFSGTPRVARVLLAAKGRWSCCWPQCWCGRCSRYQTRSTLRSRVPWTVPPSCRGRSDWL